MIPGIGGSGPDHWQSLWQAELGDAADRIAPRSWDDPDLDDWLAQITARVSPGTVLVAHSLGCLAAGHWLTGQHDRPGVVGAFLVAPPDPEGPEFPATATAFAVPTGALSVPTVVVGSETDPYCTPARTRRFASAWQAPLLSVGPAGHVNAESGAGSWPQGRGMLARFVDGLAG
jgi:predicted alpha/beta hydrolase family esterase